MEQRKKILVIDDDVSFLETINIILKEEGFEVFDATNAESGFEALVNTNPDIVILDKNLPDKSGFEVLKSMKKSKNFADIPVIIITADTAVSVDEAFDKGADDCIFKPMMNVSETIKRIKSLIK